MISSNPNTVAGGAGGLIGTLLVAIAGWLGADLDPVVAAAIASAGAAVALFVGRNGYDGIKEKFLHGNKPPPPPVVPPPVKPLKKKT